MRIVLFLAMVAFAVSDTPADDSREDPLNNHRQAGQSDALEGKRLFFKAQERMSVDALAETSANTMINDDVVTKTEVVSSVRIAPNQPQKRQYDISKNILVRYDARIESEGYVRIIINGMPCDRLARLLQTPMRSDRPLVCSSLETSGFNLLLLKDEERIRVVRNAITIGVLTLGGDL